MSGGRVDDLLRRLQAQVLHFPRFQRRHLDLTLDQMLAELVELVGHVRVLLLERLEQEALYGLVAARLLSTLLGRFRRRLVARRLFGGVHFRVVGGLVLRALDVQLDSVARQRYLVFALLAAMLLLVVVSQQVVDRALFAADFDEARVKCGELRRADLSV